MNLFSIAYGSLRQRWLSSTLTGLSVALGVSLMIAVLVLNSTVTRLFRQTGSGYDIVVGPHQGSGLQIVLSTIYRVDRAVNTLPWRFYEELAARPNVQYAIPVNVGDQTEVGNFPIVGTTPQYFLVDYVPGQKFRVKGNGLRGTWDAVIGSEVARRNGWDVGSQFKMIHSGQDDHVHDELFTVQGVLAPTGTPNDRSVFVHIDGFFQLDDHSRPWQEMVTREAIFFGESEADVITRYQEDIEELRKHENETPEEHAHHHHHGPVSTLLKSVSSILIVFEGNEIQKSGLALKWQTDFSDGNQAQAINPVRVMDQLLRNLVGNIQLAFLYLTGLIIAVSGIGIFVSIYNSMSDRKREIAIMRALGARRGTVFSLILLESMLLCLLGGISGILLGHGLVFVAAPIIEARSGLLIDPLAFNSLELVIVPVLLVMATFVGFLPARTAYSTDVAEALQS
ncbi:MAG: ABC transporter permease [Planctomycetaceae bacterium]|nr:ABC transporter permease [Planctomycetaceae bacterium]